MARVPRSIGGLDHRARQFAGMIVKGSKPWDAARFLGLSEVDAAAYCAETLTNPHVIHYIKQRHASTIATLIVPLAIREHEAMLKDKATPHATKARLIDIAYSYGLAGVNEPDDATEDDGRSLAQLELEAAAVKARIEQRIANMKTVKPDPGSLFE